MKLLFEIPDASCLRCGQERSNHLEDVGITLGSVVKTRCVNESHPSTVDFKRLCHLHDVCAGLQSPSDSKVRPADHVDKLVPGWSEFEY